MCVQNLDDSRGLAIRITYRISLRSSSLWEPRHPLLKVVQTSIFIRFTWKQLCSPLLRMLHSCHPFGFRLFWSSLVVVEVSGDKGGHPQT